MTITGASAKEGKCRVHGNPVRPGLKGVKGAVSTGPNVLNYDGG